MVQGAWATDYSVKDDAGLRAAIADNGANITVTADIDLSNSTLSIAEGTTVTIDLGGHTLDRGLTARNYDTGGQVITVREGATLNLSNGTLKGGWGGAGGALVNEGGTVTLTDVMITDNVADDRGGGVCNRENGTLTMTDVTIINNHSNDKSDAKGGGGFFNETNATATLTNVIITGNEATVCGGGGICNFGTLTLNSCTIQNNAANTHGGGIWQEGTLNVQGGNLINDNHRAEELPDNLYLRNGYLITVTGALSGDNIYLNMQTPGTFTSGYNDYNSGVHPSQRFTPDYIPTWQVGRDNNNEARLDRYQNRIGFIERSWDDVNKKVVAHYRSWSEDEYTVLDEGKEDNYVAYEVDGDKIVVKGNPTFDGAVQFTSPHVAIVLTDNSCLKAEGVNCNEGMWDTSITIYAEEGSGTLGKINSNAFWNDRYSGIGEYFDSFCPVTIHGGDIYARGGRSAPGIGSYTDKGEDDKDGGDITIYGGKIEAIGGSGGTGIGGGSNVPHYGTISIYGGTITAKAITSDETLYASNSAPGIGGGNNSKGGTTHIYGGDITAEGLWEAAGIGCSQTAESAGHIIIDGGHVVARGATNFGAGIGGGDDVSGGIIEINGGHVEAYGGDDAAGIGGGEGGSGGTITITGGYVYAEGKDKGAGIGGGQDGAGGNITITGGTVIAQSGGDQRAIGAGYGSDSHGSLTFADDLGVFVTKSLNRSVKENRVIDCRNFAYVKVDKCAHGEHEVNSCKYCLVTDEELHTFGDYGECGVCGIIGLADNANNSDIIEHWDGATDKAVIIFGRKLYKDNSWNTLTLPFDVIIAGSILDGAVVKELLKSSNFDDEGLLTLNFSDDLTTIEAGVPYIVKWTSGDNIVSPVFEGVAIDKELNNIISDDGKVEFIGNFSPVVLPGGDKENLYLGANNKLYTPSDDRTMNAFRSYFHVDLGTSQIKRFVLNFGNDEPITGIIVNDNANGEDVRGKSGWFTLQGIKLPAEPTLPGIYIKDGKKVIK